MSRTLIDTQTASLTFLGIDVGEIVLNGDGIKLADFLALAAADTCILAVLHGYAALVLVDTFHPNTAGITLNDTTLLAKLDDEFGTSLHTCTAGNTLLGIDLGKTTLLIDVNGIELTGFDTVTQTDTSEDASRLTCKRCVSHSTALCAVVNSALGSNAVFAVTAHNCEFGIGGSCLHTQNTGHLRHDVSTAHGAHETVEGSCLDASISHTMTSGEAATAAVCAGKHFLNLTHAWVFVNIELLCHQMQYQSAYGSNHTKYDKSNQNQIHSDTNVKYLK